MTREEAVEVLKERYLTCVGIGLDNHANRVNEALDMAIEALTYQNLSKPNNTCEVDLISREVAIDTVCEECEWERKCHEECQHIETLKALPSADAVQRWIPFKMRPLTDEEKQEYPDWTYIFDCPLPDDEEEILLSNGKYVWTDMFINDGECYLDGGDDIDEGMAWMPLPKPYREDGEE